VLDSLLQLLKDKGQKRTNIKKKIIFSRNKLCWNLNEKSSFVVKTQNQKPTKRDV